MTSTDSRHNSETPFDRYDPNVTPSTAPSVATDVDDTHLQAGVIIKPGLWPLQPAPKRWLGYVRVSTESQARDGDGLDIQVQQILDWARLRGDVVCAIYGDPGVSGSIQSLPDRVGFWQMIADAPESHRATGIVVPKLDRLSRDFIGQEMLLMDCANKWKLEVRSTYAAENEALDGDSDPQRKMMRQILGIFAEYERATIKNRMILGRRRKMAKGGYGGGPVPYGCKVVDGVVVDDPEQRRWIGRGITLRKMGLSHDAIAQYWIESGFPPPKQGMWGRERVRWVMRACEDRIPAYKLDALGEDYIVNKRGDSRYRKGRNEHHSGAID
jgi:DNA invertase Pin-like site-specific DNA recombinase